MFFNRAIRAPFISNHLLANNKKVTCLSPRVIKNWVGCREQGENKHTMHFVLLMNEIILMWQRGLDCLSHWCATGSFCFRAPFIKHPVFRSFKPWCANTIPMYSYWMNSTAFCRTSTQVLSWQNLFNWWDQKL